MSDESRVPRDMRTPTTEAGAIISDLTKFYAEMFPEKPEHAFVKIFGAMWDDETSGDDLVEDLGNMEEASDEEKVPPLFVVMLITCAYGVQAMKAELDGSHDIAWAFVADASYWLGGLMVAEKAQETPNDNLGHLFSELGKGGVARHEPNMRLKEFLYSIYEEGKYVSANKAAHELKDQVLEHGRKIGAVLTIENAQRTIAEWIRCRPSR